MEAPFVIGEKKPVKEKQSKGVLEFQVALQSVKFCTIKLYSVILNIVLYCKICDLGGFSTEH